MKKIILILSFMFISGFCLAAGSSSSSGGGQNDNGRDEINLYQEGEKLIKRAKKLEAKNKEEKAKKLYLKAYNKFKKAYSQNKRSADILNYLGYTLRKKGDLEKAETYYLKGLKLDAGHLGINEYLGELYVETNRINLAKERLAVLKGCECEEFKELKELIENQ